MSDEFKPFAVVDVETTGFGKHDRICEIGLVLVDPETLEIVGEYETLINPKRDVGPVHIHQITASMVVNAPTFEQIAGDVAAQLNQSVLVAHNLPFDRRMLAQEFERINVGFDAGTGVCTLTLTGEKLTLAAKRYGIKYHTHHRALEDARVAAQLFQKIFDGDDSEVFPMQIDSQIKSSPSAAVARDVTETSSAQQAVTAAQNIAPKKPLIEQICEHTRFPTSEEKILQYLNLLNEILIDLMINPKEQKQIHDLSHTLELTGNDIKWANEVYLQTLIAGAKRDGIITEKEKNIMNAVAELLSVSPQAIPSVTKKFSCATYPAGTRVCFTGTAISPDGEKLERRFLESQAATHGLQPVHGVTKKGCDLLVAQDVCSMSGKTQKAGAYDIKIISVTDFLSALDL